MAESNSTTRPAETPRARHGPPPAPAAPARAGVGALLLAHLCVTLFLAYRLNIWVDEAYTLHTTAAGAGRALRQAVNFELQPPAYFGLLSLWRAADGSIFFARLFSVLCAAATIPVAAALSRRFFPALHPAWVAGAVALHPFAVWAATETRVYALVILLSSLLMLLFFDGFLADAPGRRARALYCLLSVLALYTHYYLGFVLAGNACALLALGRWRALWSYVLWMAAAGLCFVPMLFVVRDQLGTLPPAAGGRAVSFADSLAEAARATLSTFYEYALPSGWEPAAAARRWAVRAGFVFALFVFVRGGRRRPAHVAAWVAAASAALFFLGASLLASREATQARHGAALFLPLVLVVFAAVEAAPARALVLRAWAAVSLFFFLTTLAAVYAPLAKRGDWERVASYIASAGRPGQPVLVYRASAALPLGHYYAGPLVPLPSANRFDTYDWRGDALVDAPQLAGALRRAAGAHEYLWLVTDDVCPDRDGGYGCRALDEFVGGYAVVEGRSFFRSEAKLLRRLGGRAGEQ